MGVQQAGHFFQALGAKLQADAVLDAALIAHLYLVRTQNEFERDAGHAARFRVAPAGHQPNLVERTCQLSNGAEAGRVELTGAAECRGIHELEHQFAMWLALPFLADRKPAASRITAFEDRKEALILLPGLLR